MYHPKGLWFVKIRTGSDLKFIVFFHGGYSFIGIL